MFPVVEPLNAFVAQILHYSIRICTLSKKLNTCWALLEILYMYCKNLFF